MAEDWIFRGVHLVSMSCFSSKAIGLVGRENTIACRVFLLESASSEVVGCIASTVLPPTMLQDRATETNSQLCKMQIYIRP